MWRLRRSHLTIALRDAVTVVVVLDRAGGLGSGQSLDGGLGPRHECPGCLGVVTRASGAMYPTPGAMARALLDARALVDGDPADSETPLMTAASYGDPEVARVLVEAGADLAAAASVTAGAVPGGTALRHAAVFGMPDVVEVLMAAGATDLVQAAAAGDITGTLRADTPEPDRVAALRLPPSTGRWT
jgi:hypothetical protein